MKQSRLWFMVCVFIFFTSGISFADTIYVDQSGGGDYTTIQSGINAAYADDIIRVGPGVYNENVIVDKNLILIGSGPNFTYINAPMNGIYVNSSVTITITGFNISAGDDGIDIDRTGITCLIKNCIIVSCGSHGIYYSAGFQGPDPIVTLINNTIIYNALDGIHVDADFISIKNNIIAFNGGRGIDLGSGNEQIAYNDVYGNTKGSYYGCSSGMGDISLNPKFIDPNAGNYALRSDSPCKDSGSPGTMYNDPDGTRNDMGAYGGPESVAFWPYIPGGPVITDLSVTPASIQKGGKITIRATGRVQ